MEAVNAFNQEVGTRGGGGTAGAEGSRRPPSPHPAPSTLFPAVGRAGPARRPTLGKGSGLPRPAARGLPGAGGTARLLGKMEAAGARRLQRPRTRAELGGGRGNWGLLSVSPVASSSREPCSEACPERAGGWEGRGKGIRDAFGSAGRCHVNGDEWERRDVGRREGTERGCTAVWGWGWRSRPALTLPLYLPSHRQVGEGWVSGSWHTGRPSFLLSS